MDTGLAVRSGPALLARLIASAARAGLAEFDFGQKQTSISKPTRGFKPRRETTAAALKAVDASMLPVRRSYSPRAPALCRRGLA